MMEALDDGGVASWRLGLGNKIKYKKEIYIYMVCISIINKWKLLEHFETQLLEGGKQRLVNWARECLCDSYRECGNAKMWRCQAMALHVINIKICKAENCALFRESTPLSFPCPANKH